MQKKPFVLIVCDGWGARDDTEGNAIAQANTPRLDKLYAQWPHTTVEASGEAVGLPDGQQGNSEVGHLTIGSGRVIRQPLSRQNHEIESGISSATVLSTNSKVTTVFTPTAGIQMNNDLSDKMVRFSRDMARDKMISMSLETGAMTQSGTVSRIGA